MATTTRYGTVGLDVGAFGRWTRLVLAFLLLASIAAQVIDDLAGSGEPVEFYAGVAAYVAAVSVAYIGAYWLLGRRLLARKNAWINTAIFVGPAFLVGFWEVLVRPWASFSLPADLVMAAGIYYGLSLILQWRIRYGGCEVVALPILLTGLRYQTYCIPLIALDAVEKRVVDRSARAAGVEQDAEPV